MIRYECDKCGMKMTANDAARYIVRMEIYAAAGHVDLDAVEKSGETVADVIKQLAQADPDEIEDQTYRAMRFDLCDACCRVVLRNPLG